MPVYVQRQLNSRPTPELASYIEGFKVAQAGVDSTAIEGIEGGERMGEPPPPALRPADLPSSLATVVSRVACSAFAMLGFGSIGTSESAESIPSSIGFTHMGPPREPELSLRDRPPSPKKSARQTLYMVERRSVKGAADAHGGPGPAPGTPRPSVLDLLDDSVFATLHTLFPSCCFRPSALLPDLAPAPLSARWKLWTLTPSLVVLSVCVRCSYSWDQSDEEESGVCAHTSLSLGS